MLQIGAWVAYREDNFTYDPKTDKPYFKTKTEAIETVAANSLDPCKTPKAERVSRGKYLYRPKDVGNLVFFSDREYVIERVTAENMQMIEELMREFLGEEESEESAYLKSFLSQKELFSAIDKISFSCAEDFKTLLVTHERVAEGYLLCVDIITKSARCGGRVVVGTVPHQLGQSDKETFLRLKKHATAVTQMLRSWYPEVRKDISRRYQPKKAAGAGTV